MKNREGRLWRLTVKTRRAVVEFVKQWSIANSERWQGVSRVGGLLSVGFATIAGYLLSPCLTQIAQGISNCLPLVHMCAACICSPSINSRTMYKRAPCAPRGGTCLHSGKSMAIVVQLVRRCGAEVQRWEKQGAPPRVGF